MPLSALAKTKTRRTLKIWNMDLGMWLTSTWEHNWWSWMKPFVEFSRWKESFKSLKIVLNGPLIGKWNMWKILTSKVHEKFKIQILLNVLQRIQEGNSMFGGCKTNNKLTIFENTEIGAKGAGTLSTHVNSLVCPKVKLHPSQHKGCHKGKIKMKYFFWHAHH